MSSQENESRGDDHIDYGGLLGCIRANKADKEPTADVGPPHLLSVYPHAKNYKMSNPNRGRCVIFNHKFFEEHTNLPIRFGTDRDSKFLRMLFCELGFNVEVHPDEKKNDIVSILKSEAALDHQQSDCFVCCILTHGDEGILNAKDGKYPIDKIFEPFRGDNCRSLAGKPKLFIIQACKGQKLDAGVDVQFSYSFDSSAVCKIPSEADFFVAYSSVPGYASWRNEKHGSWFIQSFCDIVRENHQSMHLSDMMIMVTQYVAYNFESYVKDNEKLCLKKQVPFTTSTMTRKLYFSLESEATN